MKNLNIIQSRPTLNEPAKYGRVFPELKLVEEKPLVSTTTSLRFYSLYEMHKSGIYPIHFSSSNYFDPKIIESAILKLPLPRVITVPSANGSFNVVSGGKILNSLINFIRNEGTLENLAFLTELNDKTAKEVQTHYIAKIESYELSMVNLSSKMSSTMLKRVIEESDRNNSINDSHKLRMLIFQGRATRFLDDLTKIAFHKTTGPLQKKTLLFIALNYYNPPSDKSFENSDYLLDAIMFDLKHNWDDIDRNAITNIAESLKYNTFISEEMLLNELNKNNYISK